MALRTNAYAASATLTLAALLLASCGPDKVAKKPMIPSEQEEMQALLNATRHNPSVVATDERQDADHHLVSDRHATATTH